MAKNVLKILGFFAVGMLGGIFAEQVLWPYFVERPFFEKYGLSQPPVYVTERKEVIIQENTALENAIEKVQDTIIGVRTLYQDKSGTGQAKTLEGSGLIITSDGLIVTLSELVPKGSSFYFYVGGKAVSYQILKRDAKLNLTLIKVEKNNLPTAGFADMDKIKLGERIFLIGNVFASSTPEIIVDEGIIKKIDASHIKTNIIKTEGLSGSVLFDIEGNVIGLNRVDAEGNVITIP
ncbi:MAG: serine protease, partial [Patescibacteria group bacterium]